MHTLKITLAILVVMFLGAATSAFATQIRVSLTQDNVLTACGTSYRPLSGGAGVCSKACYGGATCYFQCGEGGKDCWGVAFPAGSLVRAGGTGISTIPCDPVFCKIYCGGRPYCTFGTVAFVPAQAIRPKLPDVPSSLVTPVPGGNAPSAPASSVPVLE